MLSTPFSNIFERKAEIYCEAARWSASSIRLFWKMTGCGALIIASRSSRGSPRSAAGQREYVVDQLVGMIFLDLERPVGRREAALVRHHQPELVLEQRHHTAPGPVRFRKAMQQDHRRRILAPRQRD